MYNTKPKLNPVFNKKLNHTIELKLSLVIIVNLYNIISVKI